jgi:alkyl sulfatase BDS1-like metallo-beta-lactamase superfamily hydrolase
MIMGGVTQQVGNASHGRPVSGTAAVADVLSVYRDAIQFIHDQAIRHMNRGLTQDELADAIPALPPHLAEHSWLGEYYGTVKHSVRQVSSGQLGGSTAPRPFWIRCRVSSVCVARST